MPGYNDFRNKLANPEQMERSKRRVKSVKNISAGIQFVAFALIILILPLFCPASDDEIPRITIQELKKMVDSKADIVILDVRPKTDYAKGHIKGAISLPWEHEIDEVRVSNLPRNKTVIIYCDCGPGESDSTSVALQLMNFGFIDVRVLKDPSIRGWKAAGYPME